MAARSLFSPKDTRHCLLKDSPRRIKPQTLFADLSSPSPSKYVSNPCGTPSRAKRRITDCFDSPSKNTRSKYLMSPMKIVHTPKKSDGMSQPLPVISPGRRSKLEKLLTSHKLGAAAEQLLSPAKGTAANVLGSPLRKTLPRRITLSSPLNLTQHGMGTPGKRSSSVSALEDSPAQNPRNPFGVVHRIQLDHTPKKETVLATSPSLKRFDFLLSLRSPNRVTRNQLRDFEEGGSDNAVGFDYFEGTNETGDSSATPKKHSPISTSPFQDIGQKSGRSFNMQGITTPKNVHLDSISETPKSRKRKRNSGLHKVSPRDTSYNMVSPRRSQRLGQSSQFGSNGSKQSSLNDETTPNRSHRNKKCSTDCEKTDVSSQLSQVNSKPSVSSEESSMISSGVAGGSECVSPQIIRRVAPKKGRQSRGRWSSSYDSEPENEDKKDKNSSRDLLDVLATPTSKRKRSSVCVNSSDLDSGAQEGTPSKKRFVLRRRTDNSCPLNMPSSVLYDNQNAEYFSNQEVFIKGDQREETVDVIHEQLSPSRYSLRRKTSQHSEASSGFMLPGKGRLQHLYSGSSDSNSNITGECEASPVIFHALQLKHLSAGAFSDIASDAETSLPASPVFNKKVAQIINTHSVGDPNVPSPNKNTSPFSNRSSPAYSNFSPVTTKSLAHLISSPLISSSSKDSSGKSGVSVSPAEQKQKERRSRRSLYRAETQSHL